MNETIYLDFKAATPVHRAVFQAMLQSQSGTEGLGAFARHGIRDRIAVSGAEPPAATNAARFLSKQWFSVTILPVDQFGRGDPDSIREAVTKRTLVVTNFHGKDETGPIQPELELGARIAALGVHGRSCAVS